MRATVSSKGQLVIPAPLRRKLRLGSRSQVEIEERRGGLFIRPAGKAGAPYPPVKYAPPGSLRFRRRDYDLDQLAGPDVGPES